MKLPHPSIHSHNTVEEFGISRKRKLCRLSYNVVQVLCSCCGDLSTKTTLTLSKLRLREILDKITTK